MAKRIPFINAKCWLDNGSRFAGTAKKRILYKVLLNIGNLGEGEKDGFQDQSDQADAASSAKSENPPAGAASALAIRCMWL